MSHQTLKGLSKINLKIAIEAGPVTSNHTGTDFARTSHTEQIIENKTTSANSTIKTIQKHQC